MKYINVFQPIIFYRDILNVTKALIKKNISGASSIVKDFEYELCNLFDRKYCVSTSSGTAALIIALESQGFKENDEVIVPSFTIISCLLAIVKAGLKPVFCDVDSETWNMTIENVKNVATKNTKAVLMVHTYGLTADADEIEIFCKDNNIVLIEDASEAHGQFYNSRKCGTYGKISTLSFYANKHITSGEGGAVLLDDKENYLKLRQMINLDFDSSKRFQHDNLYENYRISGLSAALGKSQIKSIKKIIDFKNKQASYYNLLFEELDEYIKTQKISSTNSNNQYWVYGLLLDNKINRDNLVKHLNDKNIESRPFFWPLHLQNAYLNLDLSKKINLPVSESLGSQGLYIPMGKHVRKKKQLYIFNVIKNYLKDLKLINE